MRELCFWRFCLTVFCANRRLEEYKVKLLLFLWDFYVFGFIELSLLLKVGPGYLLGEIALYY